MPQPVNLSKRNFIISIAILAFMYFVFGFVSWLNSILIPFFKKVCELSEFQAYLVDFAFYIAYLVMSVPAGFMLKKKGFKRGMMFGFFFLSAGAFIFVPAAMTRTYEFFLLGLFTMGTGLAILQSAANPYVTIIGPIDRTVQRMSICGVFNKFAGVVSPLIFAAFVFKIGDAELFKELLTMPEEAKNLALNELASRMIIPYSCLGGLLLCFGLFIRYSILPEIDTEKESKEEALSHEGKTNVFQFPYLVLGALAIFMHVGTQIIAITTIIRYAESMGLNLLEAKSFAPYILAMTMTGYLFGIAFIPKYFSQANALKVCTVVGLILSICVLFVPGQMIYKGYEISISIWFIVLLGLPNSLIYAGIWPLAIRNLGRFTKTGSSLLVMGLCGNAVLPLIYGHFADNIGLRSAYWVLIPCFIYLIFYAFYGHKITSWNKKIKNPR